MESGARPATPLPETLAIAFFSACLSCGNAEAREPGIAPLFPPGQTAGLPIAVPLPPGVHVGSRTAFYDAALIDNEGHSAGQRLIIASEALQMIWVPGWRLLGADYRMSFLQPFATVTQDRTYPLPPAARGSSSQLGAANLKFHFLELSWALGGGFYGAWGLSVYFPTGQWSSTAPVNIGANFWTFEPSLAFTYFNHGWNLSLHALLNVNTVNPSNNYLSGNQVFVNVTATKNIGGFHIGPVAYYQKQVTGDANFGGPTVFRGQTFPAPEQYAIGGSVLYRFERTSLQFMITQDLFSRNAIHGTKAWLNVSYKLF
jgi:hypothetical protein